MPTTNTPEPALVDTNVLVYALDPSSAFHAASRSLRDRGLLGVEPLFLSPHILWEFFSVVTNPSAVPKPLTPDAARAEVEKYATALPLVFPTDQIVDDVTRLMTQTPVSGRRIYDLVHVATMIENNIARVYTFDAGFPVVPGIDVRKP